MKFPYKAHCDGYTNVQVIILHIYSQTERIVSGILIPNRQERMMHLQGLPCLITVVGYLFPVVCMG